MDYEKEYKEALSRARYAQSTDMDSSGHWAVNYIFPILKKEKSDDEIRKALLDTLPKHGYLPQTNIKVEDAIAWLEKQGEQNLVNETDEEIVEAVKDTSVLDLVEPKFKVGDWIKHNVANFVFQVVSIGVLGYEVIDRNNYTKTISFDNEEKYHLWTIKDTKDGDVLADEYNNIGLYRGEKDEFWESYIYLGCNNNLYGFNIGGYHEHKNTKPATKEQRDLLFQKMKKEGYEWDAEKKEVKKVEQKPTDKVEPKFKVGDWVIDKQGIVLQIERVVENITNHTFGYDIVGGGYFNGSIEGVRLWTIQDAKYGDILSTDGGNIFIYTGHDDGYVYYCATTNYYDDAIIEKSTWNIADGILPASKSQINFLISKIKEKGYRWDNKKKEIYKVVIDEGKSEMDYNFTRMMLKEQKQQSAKWSEDDENVIDKTVSWLDTLCDYLRDSSSECIPDVKDVINRLKSLKERAIPQSKQDWTKEDDEMFDAIIADIHFTAHNHEDIVNQPIYEKEINWLSSIKNKLTYQQNQEWSEEDEIGLGDAMWAIRQARTIAKDENGMGNLWYAENWLKSLKQRLKGE